MKTRYKAALLLMCLPIFLGAIALAPLTPGSSQKSMWSDEHYRTIVYGAEASMATMLAHQVDAGGPPTRQDIPILEAAGWTMASTGGFSHYWLAMNMRTGKAPLDDFYYRKALALCVNKMSIVPAVYGPMLTPIYSWTPPAQPYWTNNTAVDEFRTATSFNLQAAINTLLAGGYSPRDASDNLVTSPVPGNIDHWHMPGTNTNVRNLELSCVTTSATGRAASTLINNDMHSIGLSTVWTPLPFNYIVYNQWLAPPYMSWDLTYGIGLTFGAEPVLYEMFHTDSIPFANIWGLSDPAVDAEIDAMRATLSATVAQQHAWYTQTLLNRIIPFEMVMSSQTYTCVTQPYLDAGETQPGVLRWVNAPGFGGMNDYSRFYSAREDANGNPYTLQDWLMGQDPGKLNPLTSNTAYEWALMGRVYSGLLDQHPYTQAYRAWMCTELPSVENGRLQLWNGTHRTTGTTMPIESRTWIPALANGIMGGTDPGLVEGEYMHWTIRNDMTWHDASYPVTADDCVFGLTLLVKQNNERYVSIQTLIWNVTKVTTYEFDVYYTGRYLWAHVDISGVSLLTPYHVWKPYIAGTDGILWNGDDRDHRFWDGYDIVTAYGYTAPSISTVSGTVQLTHLQGNGMCVFPQGGWVTGSYVRLIRWTASGWPYKRILKGDNNFDGYVDILDLYMPLYAMGTSYGQPKWKLEADMANPANLIDGRDTGKVYDDWGYYWYPTSTVPPGT